MPHIRLKPQKRKEQILNAALILAEKTNYIQLTRKSIADEAGCSEASVTKYFGTMTKLKRSVVRAAIVKEILAIIAQALVTKDRHVMKADNDLKQKALAQLL